MTVKQLREAQKLLDQAAIPSEDRWAYKAGRGWIRIPSNKEKKIDKKIIEAFNHVPEKL